MSAFQAPTGTRDVLAPESARFAAVIAHFADTVGRANYGLVVSPMFEDEAVFRRGAGEQTDLVTKEMYVFSDRGGRTLALRPEGTASIVRAFVQHHPLVPFKAWYCTPAFRYERPQAGRYRQHHQLGVEVLGVADADVDVEVIALYARFLAKVGLERVELKVNSMGDRECMPAYKATLAAYLGDHARELCDEHATSHANNPLRVLDCKKPECRAVAAGAPRLSESLCEPCASHFARVLEGLDALGLAWVRDELLVRGFDYYTRTTFEFASHALESAQNAIGGGGRYDGLVELLGGPATPGVGFGAGIERILLAAEAEGISRLDGAALDVFVVDITGGGAARDLTDELRRAGISADRAFDRRSLKSQFKQADRSGARLACIIGPDEEATNTVTVRGLRRPAGGEDVAATSSDEGQERIDRDRVVAAIAGRLA